MDRKQIYRIVEENVDNHPLNVYYAVNVLCKAIGEETVMDGIPRSEWQKFINTIDTENNLLKLTNSITAFRKKGREVYYITESDVGEICSIYNSCANYLDFISIHHEQSPDYYKRDWPILRVEQEAWKLRQVQLKIKKDFANNRIFKFNLLHTKSLLNLITWFRLVLLGKDLMDMYVDAVNDSLVIFKKHPRIEPLINKES